MQLAAQLSPRSRSKVASIFHEHDRDKEGSLDTMELRAAVERMGYRPSEEQLVALTKEFDFDDSSALDLLEFTALMSRLLGYRELPSEQIALLRKVRPTHPTIPRPRTRRFSPDGNPIVTARVSRRRIWPSQRCTLRSHPARRCPPPLCSLAARRQRQSRPKVAPSLPHRSLSSRTATGTAPSTAGS